MSERNQGGQGTQEASQQDSCVKEDCSGIVQCPGYRCWALKGTDSKWRDMHGTILDVLEVVAEF